MWTQCRDAEKNLSTVTRHLHKEQRAANSLAAKAARAEDYRREKQELERESMRLRRKRDEAVAEVHELKDELEEREETLGESKRKLAAALEDSSAKDQSIEELTIKLAAAERAAACAREETLREKKERRRSGEALHCTREKLQLSEAATASATKAGMTAKETLDALIPAKLEMQQTVAKLSRERLESMSQSVICVSDDEGDAFQSQSKLGRCDHDLPDATATVNHGMSRVHQPVGDATALLPADTTLSAGVEHSEMVVVPSMVEPPALAQEAKLLKGDTSSGTASTAVLSEAAAPPAESPALAQEAKASEVVTPSDKTLTAVATAPPAEPPTSAREAMSQEVDTPASRTTFTAVKSVAAAPPTSLARPPELLTHRHHWDQFAPAPACKAPAGPPHA